MHLVVVSVPVPQSRLFQVCNELGVEAVQLTLMVTTRMVLQDRGSKRARVHLTVIEEQLLQSLANSIVLLDAKCAVGTIPVSLRAVQEGCSLTWLYERRNLESQASVIHRNGESGEGADSRGST